MCFLVHVCVCVCVCVCSHVCMHHEKVRFERRRTPAEEYQAAISRDIAMRRMGDQGKRVREERTARSTADTRPHCTRRARAGTCPVLLERSFALWRRADWMREQVWELSSNGLGVVNHTLTRLRHGPD